MSIYRWLGRPLTSDFAIHLQAWALAVERMVSQGAPSIIAGSACRLEALARLLDEADNVAKPLRAAPQTLLRGDYWTGNLILLPDGRLAALDWQLAGLGPGVLDLLVFVNASRWWTENLPVTPAEPVGDNRTAIAVAPGQTWPDAEWELLWDQALMWRCLQEWLDLLAAMPRSLVEARAELHDEACVRPVKEAIERRP